MAKSLTASKKVMKNYLSELLTDNETIEPKESEASAQVLIKSSNIKLSKNFTVSKKDQSLEKLLQKVTAPVERQDVLSAVSDKPKHKGVTILSTQKSRAGKPYRQGDFQAMFFDVAGLTIAVPLIELGGIHKVSKITSLMGKPEWFKGVMLHREDKINVVDTALWVMPEKYDETLKNSINYQYIIMLNDSSWGLMAEYLVDTVTLKQNEVKWLDGDNKRPWLSGLVKEKMCALLDVSALIKLLDEGSDIYQKS